MGIQSTLFNHEIISSRLVSQAQQIHDIFCEEIQAGRWQIGERLPSVASISEMTGIGHKAIQAAFDMLKEKGYIKSKRRAGTFLVSLLPRGARPIGVIGVLMERHESSRPIISWRLHNILETAEKLNYLIEIKQLDQDDDWESVDIPGKVFSERVQGVISLVAFQRKLYIKSAEERLPIVFLCRPYDDCFPLVATDERRTYFELTRRVIALGHMHIVFCANPGMDQHQIHLRMDGYEKAMNEAGLEIDNTSVEQSRQFVHEDLNGFRAYLRRWVRKFGQNEKGNASYATAIVCGLAERALMLVSVADMMGIRIPEDVSIVTLGAAPIRGEKSGQHLTGYVSNREYIMKLCFDILSEQIEKGCIAQSVTLTMPGFVEGNTLIPPRDMMLNDEET